VPQAEPSTGLASCKEIHPDLQVLGERKLPSRLGRVAVSKMVLPFLGMTILLITTGRMAEAGPYIALLAVIFMIGLAVAWSMQVNSEESRKATWIFNNCKAIDMEGQLFTVEEKSEGPTVYPYVLTLEAHPGVQFEPYVITKDRINLPICRDRSMWRHDLNLSVFVDPESDLPIAAEDKDGTRYWLRQRRIED